MEAFLKYRFGFFLFWAVFLSVTFNINAQIQNFESNIFPASFPLEFLPGWYGNEVRETASRIFQANGVGRGNSRALAVQPISTFNGQLWIRLNIQQNPEGKVVFWARSVQNGTGTRPALVFYSWGKSLEGEFVRRTSLVDDLEFRNENQEFRKFTLEVPESLAGEDEIFLKIEINYGPGTGSAARWILDDFFFGEVESDLRPPQIDRVKGYGKNELWVQFDEKVDPVFSLLPPAYSLEGTSPDKIVRKSDSTLVLTFENALVEGKDYVFEARKVPDLEGNVLQDTSLVVQFFDPSAYGYKSLVINELMPAPRADQDLPNTEYVELYNPNLKEFRLDLLKLGNSRNETNLTEAWLAPGEYLILVPKGQENAFLGFGKVMGVLSWPTLLNSGDQVTLKSQEGTILDQLSFSTSTWGGSEFSAGGYSLEVPNPYFLCENSSFLKPSQDPLKGTPGRKNSRFSENLDLTPVLLKRAYFLDSISFMVELEGVISGEIHPDQVVLSPNILVDKVEEISSGTFRIWLKSSVVPDQLFQMSLQGLLNCKGEDLGKIGPVPLVLASTPKPGEIHLTEVLFDPLSGDPKFVEIYNSSSNYLNLDSWALSNLNDQGQVAQIRVFGDNGTIIPPNSFLAISTDPEKLKIRYPKSSKGEFLQIPTLPSYPISGGTVVLLRNEKEVVEKFTYSSKLHHPLIQNSKGVSLERISIRNSVNEPSNWASASGNEDFGTPGRKNSQFLDEEDLEEILKVEPKVFDPEGNLGPAFTTISYELEQAGWVGSLSIYSSSGNLVASLCKNEILGTHGVFVWDGVDENGARVKPGYYVLLAEIFDLEGRVRVIKKTIVVAFKF